MLSDTESTVWHGVLFQVLMHLVVLGAFGRVHTEDHREESPSLNAPCGAGCFRTGSRRGLLSWLLVLMHLVVLGAFGPLRRTQNAGLLGLNAPCGAGCFRTASEAGYQDGKQKS